MSRPEFLWAVQLVEVSKKKFIEEDGCTEEEAFEKVKTVILAMVASFFAENKEDVPEFLRDLEAIMMGAET